MVCAMLLIVPAVAAPVISWTIPYTGAVPYAQPAPGGYAQGCASNSIPTAPHGDPPTGKATVKMTSSASGSGLSCNPPVCSTFTGPIGCSDQVVWVGLQLPSFTCSAACAASSGTFTSNWTDSSTITASISCPGLPLHQTVTASATAQVAYEIDVLNAKTGGRIAAFISAYSGATIATVGTASYTLTNTIFGGTVPAGLALGTSYFVRAYIVAETTASWTSGNCLTASGSAVATIDLTVGTPPVLQWVTLT
jgi:hypothetical protein